MLPDAMILLSTDDHFHLLVMLYSLKQHIWVGFGRGGGGGGASVCWVYITLVLK